MTEQKGTFNFCTPLMKVKRSHENTNWVENIPHAAALQLMTARIRVNER
jgi:hypothetical protein